MSLPVDKDFANLVVGLENDPEYMTECAIIEFTEEVCKRMDALGINRAELARRLGTSQAYITKLLQGNANFTLKSMVKIAMALESEYRSHLQPDGVPGTVTFVDELQQPDQDQGKLTSDKAKKPRKVAK